VQELAGGGDVGCLRAVGVGLADCDTAHGVCGVCGIRSFGGRALGDVRGVWAQLGVALVTGAGARAERRVGRVVKTAGMVVGGEG
jgi:hypothetical protein